MIQYISPNSEFVPGTTYRLEYTIDGLKIGGFNAIDYYSDSKIRETIENTLKHVAEQQNARIKDWQFNAESHKLTVDVLATAEGSPILLAIGAGIVAAAIIYGLYLTLTGVARIFESGSAELDLFGLKGKLPLVPLLGLAIVGFLYFRK